MSQELSKETDMSDLSFTEAQQLRLALLRNRSPYLNKWRTTSEFLSPRRFNDGAHKNAGESKESRIINNVGRRALRTFVSGMMNGATSRARPWFNLTTLDEDKAQNTEAKRYFTQVESIFNSRFQISNLYRVLPMAYKDVGVYSNSAYAMLPHDRYGFYFYPFAIGSYCIANDNEGNVTTFMREFTLSVRQVVERYGELNANGHIDFSKLGGYIKEAWEQKRYLEEVTLCNIILPNTNPKPKEKVIFSKDKLFQSYTYIISVGGGHGTNQVQSSRGGGKSSGSSVSQLSAQFISVKGYDYFPVICPRWEVEPEADYGDEGPGEIACGDVQTLQEMEKSRLNAIDKLLRPPMVGPAKLRKHQASILAGGITYLDVNDKINQFRPAFTVDPKLNDLIGAKQEYEQAIKSAFFEDLFLMLSNERTVSHVTARQIDEQAAEKLSALGPVMGQLDQDQNRKLIDNAFIILGEQGVLPQKPKVLEGQEIRPEYVSILAQAQKASLVSSAEKFVGFTAETAKVLNDPSLLRIIKGEQMVREYGQYLGISPVLVADELEFRKIQEGIAQQEAAQARQASMAQAAQTAKDFSQSEVTDNNILGMIAQGS